MPGPDASELARATTREAEQVASLERQRAQLLAEKARLARQYEGQLQELDRLKQAVRDRATISHEILNYKKDGTAFWNELHMAPMLDDRGELLYFIATQVDITERINRQDDLKHKLDAQTEALRDQAERTHHMAREMTHRVRNSLALIQAMLRMQLSSLTDETARNALIGALSRIQAIVEIQRIIDESAYVPSYHEREVRPWVRKARKALTALEA